jgi:hypothetical protein
MDKKTGKRSFKGALRIGTVMLVVAGTGAVWGQSKVDLKEVPIKASAPSLFRRNVPGEVATRG